VPSWGHEPVNRPVELHELVQARTQTQARLALRTGRHPLLSRPCVTAFQGVVAGEGPIERIAKPRSVTVQDQFVALQQAPVHRGTEPQVIGQ